MVRGVQFVLAHVPDLVCSGSKPRRELGRQGPGLRQKIRESVRSFTAAVAYAPHQVMIGNLAPEALWDRPRPWHATAVAGAAPEGPGGGLIDQSTFWAWLARADAARLVTFTDRFASELGPALSGVHVRTASESALEAALAGGAEPLYAEGDHLVGVVAAGHEADESLTGAVLLENAAAKVTGALALRRLLSAAGPSPSTSSWVRVRKRWATGISAAAETWPAPWESSPRSAGPGADVKAFRAAPVHALIMAGALVQSGLHRRVVVVAGGSLAKIGMKFLGHLGAGYPILEDVLVGVAIDVGPDDGVSPRLRLDTAATLRLGDGDAPHQVATALTVAPLRKAGLRLSDIDRFAVELHNPDITEPAGSGDVPANNYRVIAALAAQAGEIGRDGMAAFARARGLPGFSPTQGHIASAVPYLPHALAGLTSGGLGRVQLVAKGSLFLGRMTTMGDGASIVLERNGG